MADAQERTGVLATGAGWRVRWAEPEDVAEVDAMIRELAEYEREPEAVQASPADLHEVLFGADAHVRAFVAEVSRDIADADGAADAAGSAQREWEVAGTAIWFLTYSTWTGRPGAWLEDLFVRPHARGRGLGGALLAALAATCDAHGHRRAEWAVLDWNTDAQAVYRAVGARPQDGWTTWRLTGGALTSLAARGRGASARRGPETTGTAR